MASVSGVLTVRSIDGNKVPKSVDFPFTTSSGLLADMQAWATGLIALYDAVIEGQIILASIRTNQPFTGTKTAPISGSNNAVGALYDFRDANNEQNGFFYPSWIPAGFDPAHENLVLQSQAAVAPFQAYLLAPSNNTSFVGEDDQAIASVYRAVKSTRKQRKALGRAR